MKKLILFLLLICAGFAPSFAQNILPNISYNGQLTSTCSTANAACTNAVFVTTLGTSGTPQSSGAGSTLDVAVANYAAATVTISGTYSGVTINFEFSDPTGGTNYFSSICARTDVNVLEASEAVPNNAVRAWQCPVWAAMRFRVRASAFTSGAANINITLTQAAIDPSLVVAASPPVIPGSTDACQDLSQQKSSAFANITTATTTTLVSAVAAQNVYVCSYEVAMVSVTTAGTLLFQNTTPTTLSPTFSVITAVGQPVIYRRQGPGTVFSTGAGLGLQAVSTIGTTPNYTVWITFVQQ